MRDLTFPGGRRPRRHVGANLLFALSGRTDEGEHEVRPYIRASSFVNCNFARAKLAGADLRRSLFQGCGFFGADMIGALLSRRLRESLELSASQQEQIQWRSDDGPEPAGG